MKTRLAFIAAIFCFLALRASAQTTVTGTFKPQTGQTPAAAGLTVLQNVNGTPVCGELTFVAYNAGNGKPTSLLWNNENYLPQQTIGYVRCSDGVLINPSGAAGVSVIPNVDAQPAGSLTWMQGGLTASSDGTVPATSWSEAKAIPDQSSVDWGSLPVATIVDVGYQTVELNGVGVNPRPTLNFIGGATSCVDNNASNRTDCTYSPSGFFPQTNSTNNSSQTNLNFVNNSPFTWSNPSSGNEQLSFSSQSQNLVLASPNGSSGIPTFRALVASDIPALPYLSNGSGAANLFMATPNGSSGPPSLRSIVAGDIPPGNSCPANQFANSLGTGLQLGCAQPSFTNISGTISSTQFGSQTQNTFLAAPNGSTGNPSFRTLVGADLPDPSATSLGGIESFASVTHQWISSISTSGIPGSSQPACGDLSNAAPSCSTDATNASNIASGTLPPGRLPNPSATTLGGIESFASVSHEWISSISTSGVPNATQPAFSDLTGSVTLNQTPLSALGDILSVNSTPAIVRVAGNASATLNVLTQTGTGSASALPAWSSLAGISVPVFTGTINTNDCVKWASSTSITDSGAPCAAATFETNSVSNSSQATLNFLNGTASDGFTPTFTNTSAGNVQAGISVANESANVVFAGPSSGVAATPSWRALVGADLPAPSSSTLGGVESFAAVSHEWINSISTLGVPSASQPAFSDLSGSIATGQVPAGNSCGTNQFANSLGAGLALTCTQPAFSNLSGTIASSQFGSQSANFVLAAPNGSVGNPTFRALVVADLPSGIPNSDLANPSTTVNNQTCTLGSSCVALPIIVVPNSGSGTVLNTLTKTTGAPSTAIEATTTDTGGVVGVTTLGAGTSGSATVTTSGQVPCAFDASGSTAGDYVQISSATNGDCHDAGSSYPATGQVVGRVFSTNAGAGTYTIDLFDEIQGPFNASNLSAGTLSAARLPSAMGTTPVDFTWSNGVTGNYLSLNGPASGTDTGYVLFAGTPSGSTQPTVDFQNEGFDQLKILSTTVGFSQVQFGICSGLNTTIARFIYCNASNANNSNLIFNSAASPTGTGLLQEFTATPGSAAYFWKDSVGCSADATCGSGTVEASLRGDGLLTAGVINSVTGFQVNGAAPLNHCLVGNGTDYVDSSSCSGGGGGTTTNSLTFNNGGSGGASGSTFNGSAALTVSYNTIGAAASNASTTVNQVACALGSTCTASGATVTYTANQTAAASDNGKLVLMNCSSACAYTLPATQPANAFYVRVMTIGSTNATVALGGSDTFNGTTSVPVLNKWRPVVVYANTAMSTDYEGDAPLVAGSGITLTPAANGLSISDSWASLPLGGTNTGTGMVLAPTSTSTVPLTINCPTGITVDCQDWEINGVRTEWMDSNGNFNVGTPGGTHGTVSNGSITFYKSDGITPLAPINAGSIGASGPPSSTQEGWAVNSDLLGHYYQGGSDWGGGLFFLGNSSITDSSDTYTSTYPLGAYAEHQAFLVKPPTSNTTTTPTVNINTLGALTLVKCGGAALAVGDFSNAQENMIVLPQSSGWNTADLINPVNGCGSGGGGSSVEVNGGSALTTANFNGTTPSAGANQQNITWQVSGSSVSAEVPLATTSQVGMIELATDLGNTDTSPQVVGLLGKALPSLATGYLNYTGSAWALTTPVTSLAGDGTIFTNSGGPFTGAVTPTLLTQTANTFLAGPSSGSAAAPTFRSIVAADEPNTLGTTVGVGGMWNDGSRVTYPWNLSTFLPVLSTMYGTQVNITSPATVGHATVDVTTANSSNVLYVCVYNSSGSSLLWSTNFAISSGNAQSGSASQVTLAPGNYLVTYEQTGGATGSTLAAFFSNTPADNIINKNGSRFFTTANTESGSACPATTGTLTANGTQAAAILLEP